jgi:hypothetical protein
VDPALNKTGSRVVHGDMNNVDPRDSLIADTRTDHMTNHPLPPPSPNIYSKNLLVNVDSLETFCPTSLDPCVAPSIPAVESPRLGKNCLLFRLNVASVSRIVGYNE